MAAQRRFPMPESLMDRWKLRVQQDEATGCWVWIGARWPRGYGKLSMPGTQKRVAAHRWGYEQLVGSIPDGMELDHLCRNHSCVNPAHLEPVSHVENVRRGVAGEVNGGRNRAVTHCPKGHPYDAANTYKRPDGKPGRNCRACSRAVAARRRAEARSA